MGDDLAPTQYEVISKPVSSAELRSLLPTLSQFLNQLPAPLIIEYGWGCDLPTEQLWQPSSFEAASLQTFIEAAEQQGLLTLGGGDIIVRADSTHVRLCHESDVHLVSTSTEAINDFVQLLRSHSIMASKSVYSINGPRSWSDA